MLAQQPEPTEKLDIPTYQEVAILFFEQYDFDGKDLYDLVFAHKPDGWYVVDQDYATKTVYREELFWSSQLKDYLALDYPKTFYRSQGRQYPFLNAYLYDRCYYYGYANWSKDVIDAFSNEDSLNDQKLEALARAYSNYGAAFIRNHYGFQPEGELFKEYAYEKIPQTNIDGAYNNLLLACKTFRQLQEQNPEYQTSIGKISTKLSNEHLSSWLMMRSIKEPFLAKEFLRENLYDPFMISYAKNYLTTCAPNAILFTQGDNDTYPLWYVQEVEGFRTDVLVINLQLLNKDWYLDMLKDDVINRNLFSKRFPKAKLTHDQRNIVVLEEDTTYTDFMPLQEMLKHIAADHISPMKDSLHYFPSRNLSLAIDYKKGKRTLKKYKKILVAPMQWTLPDDFLYRSEFLMLDIILQNQFKRPIYLAVSIDPSSFLGLESYFQLEGMAYQLLPIQQTTTAEKVGAGLMNQDIMYDQLMKKFTYGACASQPLIAETNEKRIIYNYRGMFISLANQLLKVNKSKQALEVLDYCQQTFPNNIVANNQYSYKMIELYYQLKEPAKANKLVEESVNNLIAMQMVMEANDDNLNQYIEFIINYAEEQGQTALSSKLKQRLGL